FFWKTKPRKHGGRR
uniref:Probursin tetradecapeptide n=1 Tax=Bos taurus TaxID=9913 RepID=Q7M2Q3_BOVIN